MITFFAARSISAVSAALIGVTSPAGCAPAAAGAAPPPVPKPPAMTLRKLRFIARHMMYERIAPRRADERAGDDQQIVREHEAGRRRGPARVAVEHRHDDRHVRAADRHDHVHAEEQRDHRHQDERQHARRRCRAPAGTARRTRSRASRPARLSQWRAGSSSGLPPILPDSLPNAMTEPENVTAPIRMPM